MKHEQSPLVLVFSTAFLPLIGGAEVAIDEITKRVKSMRFLIITARFSREHPRHEKQGHVEIIRVGFGFAFDKWLLPFFGFWAGYRALAQNTRAVLWGMMISQGSIAAYFLKIVYPKIPLVITLQEGDSEAYREHGRAGFIYFFWKRILRRADRVTAISAYLAVQARRAGFRGEVAIIPNGVDEQYVSASFEGVGLEDVREELHIAPGERVVISVSRLVEKNGIADLLKAFALLRNGGTQARLVLVGDGPEKANLASLAGKLALGGSVLFAGSIRHDELLRYYRMSDIFVRPSRSEGLGSAFLEAMGAGVPVVATPIGGIVDFIEDGKTGVLAKPENPESIAAAILKVLEDPVFAGTLKENARELIIQKYLWVDIVQKMEEVFRESMQQA